MSGNIIKNASDLTSHQDVATNNYVDRNTITVGDVVPSDINMSVGSNRVRSLGCTDLTPGNGFVLTLRNFSNSLEYDEEEPPKKFLSY